MLRDHVFSNVYVCQYDEENTKFNFDNDEINGLVKVNAKECLQLLNKDIDNIRGVFIVKKSDDLLCEERDIIFDNFLVSKGETAIGKYGDILNKVISLT